MVRGGRTDGRTGGRADGRSERNMIYGIGNEGEDEWMGMEMKAGEPMLAVYTATAGTAASGGKYPSGRTDGRADGPNAFGVPLADLANGKIRT